MAENPMPIAIYQTLIYALTREDKDSYYTFDDHSSPVDLSIVPLLTHATASYLSEASKQVETFGHLDSTGSEPDIWCFCTYVTG
jgi:hypothetical protein